MKKYLSLLFALVCLVISLPSLSSTITNSEVDKFLKSVSITSDLLDKVKAKVNQDDALSKKLAKAQLEGMYMREMTEAVKGWPEYTELEALVRKSGFGSVDEWSLVVDRVFGVVSSAQWVVLVASMPMPHSDDKPVLTRETNIFEYLQDENNDPKLRQKYAKQLDEMCAKMCYDRTDLSVVGPRYSEIKSVIKDKK